MGSAAALPRQGGPAGPDASGVGLDPRDRESTKPRFVLSLFRARPWFEPPPSTGVPSQRQDSHRGPWPSEPEPRNGAAEA